jgi:hypothetical protein
MSDEENLTRKDVKEIMDDALRDFAQTLPEAIKEAMAAKIELTFGIDCKDGKQRGAVRDDMKFVRSLRTHARTGGEKLFLIAVGICGTGFLYWVVSKAWPEGQKYLPH